VVDPVPHAVNATIAESAKTNIYFFISVNIRRNNDYTKFSNKKPQRCVGVLRSFGGFNPTYL
jgi:hypothetical protein